MRLEIATNFHDQWVRYQPWITLCTGATIGSPGSTPSPVRIGMSVAPNASNGLLRFPDVEDLDVAICLQGDVV